MLTHEDSIKEALKDKDSTKEAGKHNDSTKEALKDKDSTKEARKHKDSIKEAIEIWSKFSEKLGRNTQQELLLSNNCP